MVPDVEQQGQGRRSRGGDPVAGQRRRRLPGPGAQGARPGPGGSGGEGDVDDAALELAPGYAAERVAGQLLVWA